MKYHLVSGDDCLLCRAASPKTYVRYDPINSRSLARYRYILDHELDATPCNLGALEILEVMAT